MTSLPVPVSPRTKTAQFTGATMFISSRTARNFGLDPIKPEIFIVLLLDEVHCSFLVFRNVQSKLEQKDLTEGLVLHCRYLRLHRQLASPFLSIPVINYYAGSSFQ